MSAAEKKDDEFQATDDTGYKVSEKVGRDELLAKDADDASLQDYKKKLLGENVVIDADNPSDVILYKFSVVVDHEEKFSFDAGESDIKFVLKEGSEFQLRLQFKVQRDIVSGLKYINVVYRKAMGLKKKVDTVTEMVGSYAPEDVLKTWNSPVDEAPSGKIARGKYEAKILLTDDDKKEYAHVEYSFEIAKDWS